MRRCILKHLSNENVVVEFYLARTLTVLSLALPACGVVELGAEEAFQTICFKMAEELHY